MNAITIMEKPEWITFEDIHNLLYKAHEQNRKRGFHVATAEMTGDELKNRIGEDGKCFVALDDKKLVGTTSYRIIKMNNRFIHEEVVDWILLGVLEEYRGNHIATMLYDKVYHAAKEKGYNCIIGTPAEHNYEIKKMHEKKGFRYIGFYAPKTDHYCEVMANWIFDCPYKKWETNLFYFLKKTYIKIRFKPGKIKRFG